MTIPLRKPSRSNVNADSGSSAADLFEPPEEIVPICVCGAQDWMTRPSGQGVCRPCGRPKPAVTYRQPRP